jgi:hypothetical protein
MTNILGKPKKTIISQSDYIKKINDCRGAIPNP